MATQSQHLHPLADTSDFEMVLGHLRSRQGEYTITVFVTDVSALPAKLELKEGLIAAFGLQALLFVTKTSEMENPNAVIGPLGEIVSNNALSVEMVDIPLSKLMPALSMGGPDRLIFLEYRAIEAGLRMINPSAEAKLSLSQALGEFRPHEVNSAVASAIVQFVELLQTPTEPDIRASDHQGPDISM